MKKNKKTDKDDRKKGKMIMMNQEAASVIYLGTTINFRNFQTTPNQLTKTEHHNGKFVRNCRKIMIKKIRIKI